MKALLNQIRAREEKNSLELIIKSILVAIFLGVFFGLIAKHFDSRTIIGDITTRLGVWVLLATLLAAWSTTPETAATKVFGFFAGMLVTYYAYSTLLFGFFPRYYFYAWGTIALLSPIGAYVVWYSRGKGWIAAICGALPTGLLLAMGYPFYYTFSVLHGFDLLAAIILIAVLPSTNEQRLRLIAISVVLGFIISRMDIVSLIFGGL